MSVLCRFSGEIRDWQCIATSLRFWFSHSKCSISAISSNKYCITSKYQHLLSSSRANMDSFWTQRHLSIGLKTRLYHHWWELQLLWSSVCSSTNNTINHRTAIVNLFDTRVNKFKLYTGSICYTKWAISITYSFFDTRAKDRQSDSLPLSKLREVVYSTSPVQVSLHTPDHL